MFRNRVTFVTNARVRNLLDNGLRNLAANGVGLLAMTNFLLDPGAGDLSSFRARNPTAAGYGPAGLFACGVAAALFVFARIAQRIPSPCSWIANALFHDRARNLFRFRHPVTGTYRNFFCFANRLGNCVANVTVQSLGFCAIRRAANVAIFRFANWFADRAANVTIACLEVRFANCTANVAIACLIAWLANRAINVFVACLETWLLDSAADVAVTRLIDGLADSVTLVAIARFVNVSRTGDRILFRNLVVNSPAAIYHLLFIDRFTYLFITGSAAAFRSAVIPAGCNGV